MQAYLKNHQYVNGLMFTGHSGEETAKKRDVRSKASLKETWIEDNWKDQRGLGFSPWLYLKLFCTEASLTLIWGTN